MRSRRRGGGGGGAGEGSRGGGGAGGESGEEAEQEVEEAEVAEQEEEADKDAEQEEEADGRSRRKSSRWRSRRRRRPEQEDQLFLIVAYHIPLRKFGVKAKHAPALHPGPRAGECGAWPDLQIPCLLDWQFTWKTPKAASEVSNNCFNNFVFLLKTVSLGTEAAGERSSSD